MNKESRHRTPPRPGIQGREFIGLGVTVSLLSALLGFYTAAYLMADKCYPELGIDTIQAIHRELFHNIGIAAATYALAVFALFWFFTRGMNNRPTRA